MEETKLCPNCGKTIKYKAIKCRHCKKMLDKQIENILIKVSELSKWKKILNLYFLTKKAMLDEFSLQDGILTIKCKNGKSIQSPIKDVISTLDKDKNDLITVKTPNGEVIKFADYPFTVTDEEWEQINEILQPKESMLSKAAGIFGKIMEFFN